MGNSDSIVYDIQSLKGNQCIKSLSVCGIVPVEGNILHEKTPTV